MRLIQILVLSLIFVGCTSSKHQSDNTSYNLEQNEYHGNLDSISTKYQKTYLPIYSEIYQRTASITYNLTVTISLRNTSISDTLYILKGDYFDSKGEHVDSYVKNPLFLRPLETVDIVLEELDDKGGTGANFIFEWFSQGKSKPVFQAVMLSTTGQQGISFVTNGVLISQ